jgi:hypothetical protein
VIRVDPGAGEELQAVGAVAADVQDDGPAHLGCDLLVDGQQVLLVVMRPHQVAGGVVGQDHDVRAGGELGVGEGDGDRRELPQHLAHLVGFAHADRQQKVLGAGHVVGQGPGPHDLADDGDTAAHVAPQNGQGIQHHAAGRFF